MLLDDKVWIKGFIKDNITVYYEISGCCDISTKSSTIVIKAEDIEREECSVLIINNDMICSNKNVIVTEINLIGNIYGLKSVRRRSDTTTTTRRRTDDIIIASMTNEYALLAPAIQSINRFDEFLEFSIIKDCILYDESKRNYETKILKSSDSDLVISQNGYEFLLVNPVISSSKKKTNEDDKCIHNIYTIQGIFFYSSSVNKSRHYDKRTNDRSDTSTNVCNVGDTHADNISMCDELKLSYMLSRLTKITRSMCLLCTFKKYLSSRGINHFVKCSSPLSHILANY